MLKVLAVEVIKGREGSGILCMDMVRIASVVDINDELIAFYKYERGEWYQDAVREVEDYFQSQQTVQSSDSTGPEEADADAEAAGSP